MSSVGDDVDGESEHGGRSSSEALVQRRLALALEAAQLGLWDWDLVTDALVWDDRSVAMYGLAGVPLSGVVADIERPIHPEDLPRVQAALTRAIESAGIVDMEFRVIWPDGAIRWLYARGQALVDDSGVVTRMIGTNLDATERRRAAEVRTADAERMAGLVAVAQALGDAQTESAVLEVVSVRGVALLGAQGAGLCLAGPDDKSVRVLTTSFFQDDLRAELAELPADLKLPIVRAAVDGTVFFFTDRAETVRLFPGAAELYARAGAEGSAEVPMHAHGELLGSLSVAFAAPYAWRKADRELMEAFAALTAQALERIRARDAERDAARQMRRLSEVLQRSLLTNPPQPEDLQIAVRYQPAGQEAHVGGDWYDAFLTPDGATTLVIGDVAGHDRTATAGMAQVRNILRGVAQTLDETPAGVLSALDRALAGLDVSTLATAVLGQIRPHPAADPTAGSHRVLRWSNAGHPPPLLIHPDGTPELLWRPTNLLLGVQPGAERGDHAVALLPGATLILYTDGLTERRGESLDDGLARLTAAATGFHSLSAEDVCDALIHRLAHDAEDDVALLVLRQPLQSPEHSSAPAL